jgi:excinuclease ABC subunit C
VREARGGDDYAGMREVLRRRFGRGEALGDLPDLLLVDGGGTHLEVAQQVLAELGRTDVAVVAIAKARPERGLDGDRLHRPGAREALLLDARHPALRVLARARDEAHRFAGRYQRERRARSLTGSVLDAIPGLGPARRRRLLERFGSVAGLAAAPFEDLAAMPGVGERTARVLQERLRGP